MAALTIRCDDNDKEAAAAVAEFYGFDLTSVTRAFWKQMARTKRIPLDLGNDESNREYMEDVDAEKEEVELAV